MIAIEVAGYLVAACIGLVAVGYLARSNWASVFLYNGDSITLPLMQQSLLRGEPFHWVFSSQNFAFPEAPLYFLSAVFSQSYRVTLFINGCANVVVLYALLRWIVRTLAQGARRVLIEAVIALTATAVFLLCVLATPTAKVDDGGIAPLFLFSTYYDGVILSGLAVIALALWVTRSFGRDRLEPSSRWAYGICVALIVGLTLFSDLLFGFQVLAPLGLALIVLVFLGRISWTTIFRLALPVACGGVLALGLRAIFHSTFKSNLGTYLSIPQIPRSVLLLAHLLLTSVGSMGGLVTVVVPVALVLLSLALMVFALYSQARPRLAARISTANVFLVCFVLLSAVSLGLGMVFTGTVTTRYLVPIFVFPLLLVVAGGVVVVHRFERLSPLGKARRRLRDAAITLLAVAVIAVLIGAGTAIPAVALAASGRGYVGAKCFDDFVGSSRANGVGSYWSVRPLELYGTSKGEILQADNSLSVFAWITNVGSYEGRTFSYVVTDNTGRLDSTSLGILGRPRSVTDCGSYTIFDYRGTHGETILTDRIAASVRALLAR
jgi:hypothetical protein